MPIVCPHCATSYAVDPVTFGPAGRTVRCARCKGVWLARPDDAIAEPAGAFMPATTFDMRPAMSSNEPIWHDPGPAQDDVALAPHIDSPSIAGEMPADDPNRTAGHANEIIDARADETPLRKPVNRRDRRPARRKQDRTQDSALGALFSLRTACIAMATLVAALFIWRTDVVLLLPQTATFYKAFGLEVNLRGLAFRDITLSNETVDGKSVLVIEGNIVGIARRPVELPRLRFVVRDAKGTEIYGWNTVLEQVSLKSGDTASFRSRLAAPPPDGTTLDIRFFNKRDIASDAA